MHLLHKHPRAPMAPSSPSLSLFAALVILCTTIPSLPCSCGAMSDNLLGHDLLMLGRFHRWMSAHNRSYTSTAEKLLRFEVYRRNVEYIEAANAGGELGYELGENEFTDLTHEEFMAQYAGAVVDDDLDDSTDITAIARNVREGRREMMEETEEIPETWDWKGDGYVTPAKNQKKCGSCWAFATVGAVESQLKIKTGELLDLSEQELLDCDSREFGCKGGYLDKAFEWIKSKGGVMKEPEYPYEAEKKQCRSNKDAIRRGKVYEIGKVKPEERYLQEAVYKKGPTTVAIDSSDRNLQHFKSGIYKGPCGTRLDHGVLVVGYGVKDGEKYWIVKNSWGQTWGEEGFFLMRRGANGKAGLCGIAMRAVYALV